MRSTFCALSLILTLGAAAPGAAAEPDSGKIAWFATWERGLAEAKRTGRPILLVSAAPHCRNISGLW